MSVSNTAPVSTSSSFRNNPLTESELREKVLEAIFPFTEPKASSNDDDEEKQLGEKIPGKEENYNNNTTEEDGVIVAVVASTTVKDDVPSEHEDKANTDNVKDGNESDSENGVEDEGGVCTICLEPLDNDEHPDVRGQCPHTFHFACIMDWMKRNHNQCPICRQEMFDMETYHQIESVLKQRHGMNPTATTTTNTNNVIPSRAGRLRRLSQVICYPFWFSLAALIVIVFNARNINNDNDTNDNDNIRPNTCPWPHLQFCSSQVELYRVAGTIPTSIGLATQLTHLVLSGERLRGTLPSQLGLLLQLTHLAISGRMLEGAIPTEIGYLQNLQKLRVFSSSITGPIPSEVGHLTHLRSLDFAFNDLSGPIPTDMGRLTQLTFLDLFGNDLTGPVPSELGQLTQLTSLYLSDANVQYRLPAGLGYLTRGRHPGRNDFHGTPGQR